MWDLKSQSRWNYQGGTEVGKRESAADLGSGGMDEGEFADSFEYRHVGMPNRMAVRVKVFL